MSRGGAARLEIPGAPPSLNALTGGYAAPGKFQREKKRWQATIEGYLLLATGEGSLPRHVRRIRAEGRVEFTVRRRRDEGNFRALLEKALGDALTNGGWLDDDTADRFRFERLELAEGAAQSRTILVLEWS